MTTTHDLKPEQMTPDELKQAAIDWIQNNAPDYVLQYLDQDANASHLYIVSLEMGLEDLLQQNTARETELTALRAAYKVACEIFRTQDITLPRLRNAWNTAVQQVEATE